MRPLLMEKFYTLFIATTELLTCRAVFRYGSKHDLTLEVGKEETITFSLPDSLSAEQQSDICLGFNPEMVDIKAAVVEQHRDRVHPHTSLSVTFVARDIGTTKIGITTTYKAAKSLKTFLLPTTKKPQLA